MKYDAIVIGAGFGGLSCAALLAKRGFRILLLERNPQPGGKAQTEHDSSAGVRADMFTHTPAVGDRGQIWAALREIGMEGAVQNVDVEPAGEWLYKGKDDPSYRSFLIPRGPLKEETIFGLVEWLQVPPDLLVNSAELVGTILDMKGAEIERLYAITMEEFLRPFSAAASVRAFLGSFSNLMFVVPSELASAGEYIKAFQELFRVGPGGYPKGGLSQVADAFLEGFRRAGGKALLGEEARQIVVAGGKITGVRTEKGFHSADVVISNAGIQPTVLGMLDRDCFDRGYLNYVSRLRPSWGGLGVRYYLRKEVLQHTVYYAFTDDNYGLADFRKMAAGNFPDDLSVYIRVPCLADPSLAPKGKQVAIAMTFCPPDPGLETAPWLRRFEETVGRIWPEIPGQAERKDVFGPGKIALKSRWSSVIPGYGGEAIGLGQIAGQCGPDKPPVQAPLSGLFFVGADAGGEGIGLEMAAGSGRRVARQVELYLKAGDFFIGRGGGGSQ